jgi:predicted lipid-binding transport protein (Tim44 family)
MQIGREGLRERLRWSGCGLLAGLLIGLIVGWMLHGVIGLILRVGLVVLFVLPFVAALAFWYSSRRGGPTSSNVQEATWRDLGGRGRDGM